MRNLRLQRTQSIGLVPPLGHETGQHLSDPFFLSLPGHLADGLTERGDDLGSPCRRAFGLSPGGPPAGLVRPGLKKNFLFYILNPMPSMLTQADFASLKTAMSGDLARALVDLPL